MTNTRKIPLHRESDKELIGYVVQDATGWQAQTVFGYTIERVAGRAMAEQVLREQGLQFLTGVWQYYDRDDGEWYACVLKEVYEHKVIVLRTNVMGYQDPDDYKMIVLERPTENELVKS